MHLSVIVPTCDRNDLLAQCLNELAPGRQTLDAACYEVLVSDDSAGGGSWQLIQDCYPWANWTRGPRKGPAANRNNGALHAASCWLVFIDDDCLPAADLLEQYWNAMKRGDHQVFEGAVKADRPRRRLDEEAPINLCGNQLWSCNFAIDRTLFFLAGGFNEGFSCAAMEDVDLHYRLKLMNVSVYFLRQAVVIHPWRRQSRMADITIKRFKATLYFLQQHPEKIKEINTGYYLKAFGRSLLFDTVRPAFQLRFRGLGAKLIYDFLQLYFACYMTVFYRQPQFKGRNERTRDPYVT